MSDPYGPRGGSIFAAARNRILHVLAQYAPGGFTVRPGLHRLRGVTVGERTFIGTDALIETSHPHAVSIGSGVSVGMRCIIVAHFKGPLPRDRPSVRIEDDVFIGPGVIILPNVTVGYGAVVTAGSVVTKSVPPLTMVQGNPAVPIAHCGIPLRFETPLKDFYRQLRPIETRGGRPA